MSERWQRLEAIYHDALAQPPDERAAFVTGVCAGDAALEQEVMALLANAASAASFLERPAGGAAPVTLVGRQLGAFAIEAQIGAGGMGEVYRAKDTRLGRIVAIKILPRDLAADPDRRQRFQREARAVAALNHPNICTVHDVGQDDGLDFLVMELVDGESLASRLAKGPLPLDQALARAMEIADALDKAHRQGIVHRDLKPGNVMLTKHGAKVLDFGLARFVRGDTDARAVPAPTATDPLTEPGTVLGTLQYMAPEQIEGRPADARTDIFAFGALLYEMLTGRRAFEGASSPALMAAILRADPPPLAAVQPQLPRALDRLVRTCLLKDPDDRFASFHDILLELRWSKSGDGEGVSAERKASYRRLHLLWGGVAVAAALLGVFVSGRFAAFSTPPISPVSYHQLTFRRGGVTSARFAPDGQTVFYSAGFLGSPRELFSTRPESPDSRALGLGEADVFAISPTGEMAIALRASHPGGFIRGTLATVPLTGTAPRELAHDIVAADWIPGSTDLAVVRFVGGTYRLEFPLGKTLYETEELVTTARVSPDGAHIALFEGKRVVAIDRSGHVRTLSNGWAATGLLDWSPTGAEVWFSASELEAIAGTAGLFAVSLDGRQRTLLRLPVGVNLLDVSPDGRILALTVTGAKGLRYGVVASSEERDLSWLDWGLVADLSSDGKMLLFSEGGRAGGAGRSAYIRRTDGAPAIRLGEGTAQALSPDGQYALAIDFSQSPSRLLALPTGVGERQTLTTEPHEVIAADWFADGRRVMVAAREPGQLARSYVLELGRPPMKAVTPEGITGTHVSPNGQWLVAADAADRYALYPVDGGAPRPIKGLMTGDEPFAWGVDGRRLYARRDFDPAYRTTIPVFQINLVTGRRELWKEFTPAAGEERIARLLPIDVTANGAAFAYTTVRGWSDLFLISGVR